MSPPTFDRSGSAGTGLGQKLLNPDPMPLQADQPQHRRGGIRHLESIAKGTGEGLAVAWEEGLELLLELQSRSWIEEGVRISRLGAVGGSSLGPCGGLGRDGAPAIASG